MTRIAFRVDAAPGHMYQPGAFDQSIGKELSLELPDGRATALLVTANVVDEGRAVVLLLECGDAIGRRLFRRWEVMAASDSPVWEAMLRDRSHD